MHRERLTRLRDFLRRMELPKGKRFKMTLWSNKCDAEGVHCGTVACALGWATTIFRGEGLRLEDIPGYGPLPFGQTADKGVNKAAEFFGITPLQARCLFIPTYIVHYKDLDEVTADDVANEIDRILASEPATIVDTVERMVEQKEEETRAAVVVEVLA